MKKKIKPIAHTNIVVTIEGKSYRVALHVQTGRVLGVFRSNSAGELRIGLALDGETARLAVVKAREAAPIAAPANAP